MRLSSFKTDTVLFQDTATQCKRPRRTAQKTLVRAYFFCIGTPKWKPASSSYPNGARLLIVPRMRDTIQPKQLNPATPKATIDIVFLLIANYISRNNANIKKLVEPRLFGNVRCGCNVYFPACAGWKSV
jgi:hypothetical protein